MRSVALQALLLLLVTSGPRPTKCQSATTVVPSDLGTVMSASINPCWVAGISMSYFGTTFGHEVANCNATAASAGASMLGRRLLRGSTVRRVFL